MQMAFFFNQSRCSGCLTCVIACRQWHSIDYDRLSWRRIETIEEGIFPQLRVSFLSLSCLHCQTPACASSCPTSAIIKRELDGIVLSDPERCLGETLCGRCKEACPYTIPRFNPDQDWKMEKCNFCCDRLAQGRRPICVEACPMDALDAGPLDTLPRVDQYDKEIKGFRHFEEVNPSIRFRKKK